jgi:hypothetical protein
MKQIILALLILTCAAPHVFAQGAYVEFKMTGDSGVVGTTKIYTRDGSSRSDINMASPQVPGGYRWLSVTLKDRPLKTYMLNEITKTYSEIDMSTAAAKENDSTQYEVTVIGKEKVNGYNCTHVRVKRAKSPGSEEIWVSTEVLNYKQYLSIKSKYTTHGLLKAMEAKGATGFPVRTVASERGKNIQVDLVKIEQRDNPANLFTLDGYTRAGVPGGATGASQDVQDAMKKIQDMSPEERQKFIEELRKKQTSHPPAAPH